MIVVRLIGGLGNQMFEYAAGRALALRLGTELRIDRTPFQNYNLHAYGLQHFAQHTQDAPRSAIPYVGRFAPIGRALQRIRGDKPLNVVKETAFTFDPSILALGDDVYLDGYWQSEKYFDDAAELIRADFEVLTPPTDENRGWLDRIRDCLAVSLHVRRGDYVTARSANQFHGSCSLDYYRQAIDAVVSGLGEKPTFFVFSDDQPWAQENLDFGSHEHAFVTGNDADKNYEDLRLMSACRHHIIANSTFSWWGGWLNPDPEKRVIAPRRWFAAEGMSTRDLIPSSWEQL